VHWSIGKRIFQIYKGCGKANCNEFAATIFAVQHWPKACDQLATHKEFNFYAGFSARDVAVKTTIATIEASKASAA
jgi:hypothetical protein